jgi:uncharacterized membrane protein
MQIATFFTLYAIAVPVFFIIDMFWLGVVARGFYQNQIGHLLGPINWPAAIVFYLIFLAGLVYFALMPSLESGSFGTALMLGALFGFFTYATYDLTNYATLRDWPLTVTLVDIVWGSLLGALVSSVTYMVYQTISG